MQDPTDSNLENYEFTERDFIEKFIELYQQNHDVVDYFIEPVGSKAPNDGWLLERRKDGTLCKRLLEAKIRYGYHTTSFPSTYLTPSKYYGLRSKFNELECDMCWHLAFYEDGLFIYNLTPEIEDARKVVRGSANVKGVQSNPNSEKKDRLKFFMPHKSEQSTMVRFPDLR